MKIAFLTQFYPPEVGAPQTRISHLAKRFSERGHEVTIITALPNYPTGKIFKGYPRILGVESKEKIKIIRTFVYPTNEAHFVKRVASYLSFMVSSFVFGSFLCGCVDYLVVESPPLFLGVTGIWLSFIKRAKMVFNVSDLWPESAVHVDLLKRESLSFTVAEKLEHFFYKRAWLVSGQSRTIISNVIQRFPGVRVYHLSNGADINRFSPRFHDPMVRTALSPDHRCTVLYAGLHGLAQGLSQIIRAAKLLSDYEGCRFVLLGDGPEKKSLKSEARRLGLTNVFFHDSRPSVEMPAILSSSEINIVCLKKFIPGAVPSKLYEAMASGRPVIFVGEGEGADIVQRHNAGLTVSSNDIEGIAAAVRTLSGNPPMRKLLGQNGRRAAEEFYDRNKIADLFIRFLESDQGMDTSLKEELDEAYVEADRTVKVEAS
jgi:colanic acid biosynthesis glycosyl transferase WcaI